MKTGTDEEKWEVVGRIIGEGLKWYLLKSAGKGLKRVVADTRNSSQRNKDGKDTDTENSTKQETSELTRKDSNNGKGVNFGGPVDPEDNPDIMAEKPVLRLRAVNSARDIIKNIQKVQYGSNDLSQMAREFRKNHPDGKKEVLNIAVFEWQDANTGKLIHKAFASDGIDHAEEIGIRYIEENNIDKNSITRIYSEREPCVYIDGKPEKYCAYKIRNNFPNAKVEYSFDFTCKKEESRAARKALRQEIKEIFNPKK